MKIPIRRGLFVRTPEQENAVLLRKLDAAQEVIRQLSSEVRVQRMRLADREKVIAEYRVRYDLRPGVCVRA